jgi:hypothetical protein
VTNSDIRNTGDDGLATWADAGIGADAFDSFNHNTVQYPILANGIAIYGFADDAAMPKAAAPALVAAGNLKLGETALALGADGAASTGIVARVSDKGIYTTLPDIGAGSATVDLAGNLIGIAAGGTAGLLIPTDTITALLSATTSAATTTPAHS